MPSFLESRRKLLNRGVLALLLSPIVAGCRSEEKAFPSNAIPGTLRQMNQITLSNNATDPVNDINISVGECLSDDATPVVLSVATAFAKRLDAVWSVGDGGGGLDAAGIRVAGATLFPYIISNGTLADAIFSASATNPILPSGWTSKRRMPTAILVDENNVIRQFRQTGQYTSLCQPPLGTSVAVGGSAFYPILTGAPQGLKLEVDILYCINGESTGWALIADPDNGPPVSHPTNGIVPYFCFKHVGSEAELLTCFADSLGRILVGTTVSAATASIYLRGWWDRNA